MSSGSLECRPVLRPGDQLVQKLWLAALTSSGRLPMPTVERIRQIKAVAAAWQTDADEA